MMDRLVRGLRPARPGAAALAVAGTADDTLEALYSVDDDGANGQAAHFTVLPRSTLK
jgi:hypothetical protein